VGRAVRACGDAVKAGWLARQTVVSEEQEAGRAGCLVMLALEQL